jgi:hypothetical protein
MTATIRNILIVLVIALLVVVIPGGGSGAAVAQQAVYLAFLATMWWFAAQMYRQRRLALYSLGDRRRTLVYVAVAVAFLTLTATTRLWSSSAGTIAWCVLLAAAAYAVFAVIWSARRY